MLHDHERTPNVVPRQPAGEVIPIAKPLNDAWRSVVHFMVFDTLSADHTIRPHQVGSFLRHPKPEMVHISAVRDYYAIMVEVGVKQLSDGRELWPGEEGQYSFTDAAHTIHDRLDMTMRNLSALDRGHTKAMFKDEELEETIRVLQLVESKYQGATPELPWYFDKIASDLSDDTFITYQF